MHSPPGPGCSAKALDKACTGIFLVYAQSMKNALYLDLATSSVKSCQHVAFDESFNDLPAAMKPPNARLLDSLRLTNTNGPPDAPAIDLPTELATLDISPFLFSDTIAANPDGSYIVTLGRDARPGNWLPTGGAGRLQLMFTILDPATGLSQAARAERYKLLPLIRREGCS